MSNTLATTVEHLVPLKQYENMKISITITEGYTEGTYDNVSTAVRERVIKEYEKTLEASMKKYAELNS